MDEDGWMLSSVAYHHVFLSDWLSLALSKPGNSEMPPALPAFASNINLANRITGPFNPEEKKKEKKKRKKKQKRKSSLF